MAVNSLFTIDLNSNNEGGCGYVGLTFLQNILKDSYNLVGVGSQLVTDYRNNVGEARRLLDLFFQVENPPLTEDQLTVISTAYSKVATWIENGGAYNGGVATERPILFRYANWLERRTMKSPAQDTVGETFPNVWTGTLMLINQVADYVTMQKTESRGLGKQAVPYWSLEHNAYVFNGSYGSLSLGYCSIAGHKGVTQHVLSPSTLTLCPESFGGTNGDLSPGNLAVSYNALRSVPPQPVVHAVIAGGGRGTQVLSTVEPNTINLLHELFHLVLGNDVTYPTIGEVYQIFAAQNQIVGLDYVDASVNPDTYSYAAVAYDYTLNWPQDAAGNKVEFFSGWATQG